MRDLPHQGGHAERNSIYLHGAACATAAGGGGSASLLLSIAAAYPKVPSPFSLLYLGLNSTPHSLSHSTQEHREHHSCRNPSGAGSDDDTLGVGRHLEAALCGEIQLVPRTGERQLPLGLSWAFSPEWSFGPQKREHMLLYTRTWKPKEVMCAL